LDCKVRLHENDNSQKNGDLQEHHYSVAGTFQFQLATTLDVHELDQIEAAIEKVGQELKRQLTQHVVEAADRRVVEVAQVANPELHKHGTRPFTIVTRYGEVKFQRQRLFNPTRKKNTTLIPSAIAWKTSKRRHLTAGLIDAACKESQQVSYRKTSQNLADTSGQESLIATSTVWNKKQERARNSKRTKNRSYLLRKKRQLANYEERHARGEWIASTRVEKWNDVAVSERCKHRGMSWTEAGVLAVATYAENAKKTAENTTTFHTIS
jgi:hypothetical protein